MIPLKRGFDVWMSLVEASERFDAGDTDERVLRLGIVVDDVLTRQRREMGYGHFPHRILWISG